MQPLAVIDIKCEPLLRRVYPLFYPIYVFLGKIIPPWKESGIIRYGKGIAVKALYYLGKAETVYVADVFKVSVGQAFGKRYSFAFQLIDELDILFLYNCRIALAVRDKYRVNVILGIPPSDLEGVCNKT